MKKWHLRASRQLIANQWIGVREDDCLTTAGVPVDGYYVVQKPDFVMVVALTENRELLLVRQYRHGCGEVVVECPAGYLHPGEEPVAGALRELREETGYRGGSVQALGTWFAAPAVLSNRAYLFLCTDAEREGAPQPDETEDIELLVVDFREALRRLEVGELIADLPSAAAVLLASRLLAIDVGQGRAVRKD